MSFRITQNKIPCNIHSGILNGEAETIQFLKREYLPMIKSLLKKMNSKCSTEDAKDLFGDVLMVLFTQIRQNRIKISTRKNQPEVENIINSKKSKLSSYIFGIARNIWKRFPQNPEVNRESNLENDSLDSIATDKRLEFPVFYEKRNDDWFDNFKRLSSRCKLIILLRVNAALSHVEIAELLGVTHGTARNIFCNCWKRLLSGDADHKVPVENQMPGKSKKNLNLPKTDTETIEENWNEIENIQAFYTNGLSTDEKKAFEARFNVDPDYFETSKIYGQIFSYFDEKLAGTLDLYKQDVVKTANLDHRNEVIDSCFMRLKPNCRTRLLLYYCLKENLDNITEMLDTENDKIVKMDIYHCMTKLSTHVKETLKSEM